MPRRRKRLDPASFALPVEELRRGTIAHASGLLARDVLVAARCSPAATVQVVAEHPGLLAGTDEALALLREGTDDWGALTLHALYDGDRVEAGEPVLAIEGELPRFAHLAPFVLGVLARRTRVATNARLLAEAARPKPVIMLPLRHDHWLMQAGDAQAAQIGGVQVVGPRGHAGARGTSPLAPLPHALIAAYGGDTVAAVRAALAHAGDDARLVVPVDYRNDAVATALAVARVEDARIWAVQLATSDRLVDASIIPHMGAFVPTGVNAPLVWNVRNALDAEGFGDVKILVSGAVSVDRIRAFEEEGVPVDAYGVGEALSVGQIGFAAEVVSVDGAPQSRVGAAARALARLERVR